MMHLWRAWRELDAQPLSLRSLDKLQAEKVQKKDELFAEVADLKLQRAEQELSRMFKKSTAMFKEIFWKLEYPLLWGDGSPQNSAESRSSPKDTTSAPFGIFNANSASSSKITVLEEDALADCKAPGQQWAGVRLHIQVRQGEVAAYAIEVVEGLLRLGWEAVSGADLQASAEVGKDSAGFGFGGTGKKVHNDGFEPYGTLLQERGCDPLRGRAR